MSRMNEAETSRIYDLWAKFYDATFGRLVHKRQMRAVEELRPEPGQRILDIGIGTGMTLNSHRDDVTIVGMDLSNGMLAQAAKKAREANLDHVYLVQADAMWPPFAEGSFDHVIITHTVSVVSDPPALMAWARRLVKPGGRIVVLNHFQSTMPLMAWLESVFNPIFVKLGWRSDLSLEECLHGTGLEVRYQYKMSLLDVWQIVVLRAAVG